MRNKAILAAALLVALFMLAMRAAVAQEASPQIQAMSQRLMGEINLGLQCNTTLIETQRQLAAAQAEIKKLTPAKKDEKK